MMPENGKLVGIDVAKWKVDAWIDGVGSRSMATSPEGLRDLAGWSLEHGVTVAVMEASGGYERPVAAVLRAAGIRVRIVDPKSQLSMADNDYRAILRHVAGVASAKQLDMRGFDAVMETFRRLGFESTSPRKPFGWDRPGMATNQQCRLIRALWAEWTDGQGTDSTIGTWLEHFFSVSALRFLSAEDAQKAITALKAMKRRRSTRGSNAA
jgi:Protein of unknown function (DUF1018)/Transposase